MVLTSYTHVLMLQNIALYALVIVVCKCLEEAQSNNNSFEA